MSQRPSERQAVEVHEASTRDHATLHTSCHLNGLHVTISVQPGCASELQPGAEQAALKQGCRVIASEASEVALHASGLGSPLWQYIMAAVQHEVLALESGCVQGCLSGPVLIASSASQPAALALQVCHPPHQLAAWGSMRCTVALQSDSPCLWPLQQ